MGLDSDVVKLMLLLYPTQNKVLVGYTVFSMSMILFCASVILSISDSVIPSTVKIFVL